MSAIDAEILARFYSLLGEADEIDDTTLAGLQKALSSDQAKVSPDELVRVFTSSPEDSLP